jgi:hypothetical protein
MSRRNNYPSHAQQNKMVSMDLGQFSDAVKAGQRLSPQFKQAWHMHCESSPSALSYGQHVSYDPAKYDRDFIGCFFSNLASCYMQQLGAGSLWTQQPCVVNAGGPIFHGGEAAASAGPTPDEQATVFELVEVGKAADANWRGMWELHCNTYGNWDQNPANHPVMFTVAHVFKFGITKLVETAWASPYLVAFASVAKPFLVKTVKIGQGRSAEWKQKWGDFCDAKAGGTRDPNHHDSGTLVEFFDTCALPEFGNEAWMLPFQGGAEE